MERINLKKDLIEERVGWGEICNLTQGDADTDTPSVQDVYFIFDG